MDSYKSMRTLVGLAFISLFFISQTINVAAANNQGLEWGVEVDDRFDYDVKVIYHNDTLDLDIVDEMYVIIDGLPSIADNITSLAQLTFLDFTTYWDNGTVMDDFWWGVLSLIPFILLPIGNWSLMETLTEEADESVEVTQDATYFTASRTPSETYNSTYTLMKSNGTPAYFKVDWIRSGMGDSLSVELIKEGYVLPTSTTTGSTTTSSTTNQTTSGTTTPDGYNTLLLMIGVSGMVLLVIIVVLVARRR